MMYYSTVHPDQSITIRAARAEDDRALRVIAQRDTSALPDGRLLVAADGGEIRAAASVDTGEIVADPFHRTAELVRMLAIRVEQIRTA